MRSGAAARRRAMRRLLPCGGSNALDDSMRRRDPDVAGTICEADRGDVSRGGRRRTIDGRDVRVERTERRPGRRRHWLRDWV